MGYRGRLIWPFKATIERIDTSSTSANALASQPAGYDRIFREPVKTDTTDSRVYFPADLISCQVRTELGPYEKAVQMPGGRELDFDVRLALHYSELEMMGLVNADGTSKFQAGDKLTAIYKRDGVTLKRDFSSSPLFCVHVPDRSWGLSGLDRNLLMLYFKDRREGVPS